MDTILYNWQLTDLHPLKIQYFIRGPSRNNIAADMHSAVHVGILLEGDATMQHCGEKISVHGGDVYLTPPWEPHRRLFSENGNKLLLLTVDLNTVNRALPGGADRLNLLCRTTVPERQKILNRLELAPEHAQRILELLQRPDTPERELRLWHSVLGIFVEIASLDFSAEPDHDYPRLLPALRTLGNRPLAVPEAASLCNLSESRFAHLFRRVFGMPFARYDRLYRLRCAVEEMDRLHSGLKETAANWGFYDKSHLGKARRKYLSGLE